MAKQLKQRPNLSGSYKKKSVSQIICLSLYLLHISYIYIFYIFFSVGSTLLAASLYHNVKMSKYQRRYFYRFFVNIENESSLCFQSYFHLSGGSPLRQKRNARGYKKNQEFLKDLKCLPLLCFYFSEA